MRFEAHWGGLRRRGFSVQGGVLLWGCLWGVLSGALPAGGAASTSPGFPLLLTQVPVAGEPRSAVAADGLIRADVFEGARIVLVEPGGSLRVLTREFASACDPDISFDGRRMLFAGKRDPRGHWAIWEKALDGSEARCVVQPGHDCRQPIYLSSLFTLDSPEPWFTIAYVGLDSVLDERGARRSTSLYSVKLDGSERRRISSSPNPDVDPFQMLDSRLIFSGCRYPNESLEAPGRVSLFGMNIDGTELEFYGGDQGQRIQHMGCATSGGLVVFVESDRALWDGAGQLGSIAAQRPHHSYRRLTESPGVVYLYPSDFTNDCLLVSRRSQGEGAQCAVVCYHLPTGRTDPVFDSADHHDLQAKVVRPRPMPDGRSTVVNPEFDTGLLYALNCYDADPRLQPHWPEGILRRLRVIEGVPATPGDARAGGSARLRRRLLGEVPVAADGSFNIEIPSGIPVQLQMLDDNGLALATCGWIWVMQKENRGCIGCHEDPELIPENSFVEAVRRSSYRLTLPPDKRRSVGFREDILPILKSKCASADCHGGPDTPLPLRVSTAPSGAQLAYAALLGMAPPSSPQRSSGSHARALIDPGRARTSPLIWKLFGQITARPWDSPTGPAADREFAKMPPAGHDEFLTERERRLFVEWIDLGAPWSASSEPQNPSAPHSKDKD